jgi:hypothetical protein
LRGSLVIASINRIDEYYGYIELREMDRKGRTMKNRRLWILLAGVACLGTAFWFLNFCIAAIDTESEKNITTASRGDGLPHAMQRREKINVVLVGEGPLIDALQKAFAVEINKAEIGDIELVQGIERKYQSPVLVVKLGSTDLLWTPFFATSHFTIQAGYSSSGDTTLIGETPVTIDNRYGPALHMYGEYKVRNRSWGLISRPAYLQSLADYLAQQIVAALKELYRVAT